MKGRSMITHYPNNIMDPFFKIINECVVKSIAGNIEITHLIITKLVKKYTLNKSALRVVTFPPDFVLKNNYCLDLLYFI